MKKLEELAAKAANTIIDIEIYGWPPICFGTFYQPKRPTRKPKYSTKLFDEKGSNKKQYL